MESEDREYIETFFKYSEVGIKSRNQKLYKSIISYKIENSLECGFKEIFYLMFNNIKNSPMCSCGNNVKFIDMKNGFREFCSKRCMLDSDKIKDKKKKSCIEKYGVDNPSKSKDIKEKVKKTNNEKFGYDYPLQSEEVKVKVREYFKSEYGVDNPSKIRSVRNKAENTNLERFGFKHASQSEDIKWKTKEYFLGEYGVDNPSKLRWVRDKAESTNLERFGFKHAIQNNNILEKLKITNLKRWGVEYPIQSNEIKEIIKNYIKYRPIEEKNRIVDKSKKTNLERWGVENYSQSNEFKEKIKNTIFEKNSVKVNSELYKLMGSNISEYEIFCNDCQKSFIIQRQFYNDRIRNCQKICLNCNPILNGRSKGEIEIFEFIKDHIDNVESNFRLEGKEIDVYLPDLKIGFEFNGLWWHSEVNKPKKYHKDKQVFFENKGIKIYFINEDDWISRKDIVKSIILDKIGKITNRIYARNCEVKIITDNKVVRNFLDNNHIQGYINSSIKIGLFNNNELVSIVTFGKLRISLGSKSKDYEFELLRFCSRINHNVVGGASKLFSFFKKNFKFNKLISYSDNGRSNGNLYKTLGFVLDRDCDINYYWCKNYVKYHRFGFRKDKLVKDGFDKNKTEVEIMYERGYFRFFDSGSKKWILVNNI